MRTCGFKILAAWLACLLLASSEAATGEEEKTPAALLAELGAKASKQSIELEVGTFVWGVEDKLDGWFRIYHAAKVFRVDDASQTATVYHQGRIVKWDLDGPHAGKEKEYTKTGAGGSRKVKDWSGFELQNLMETLFITDAFGAYQKVIGNSAVELLEKGEKGWRFRLTLKAGWNDVFLVKDLYPEGTVVNLTVDPATGIPTEVTLAVKGRKVSLRVRQKAKLKDQTFIRPGKK